MLAGGKGGLGNLELPGKQGQERPCKSGCFLLLGVGVGVPLQDLKWVTNDYKLPEEKPMGAQRERAHPREDTPTGTNEGEGEGVQEGGGPSPPPPMVCLL